MALDLLYCFEISHWVKQFQREWCQRCLRIAGEVSRWSGGWVISTRVLALSKQICKDSWTCTLGRCKDPIRAKITSLTFHCKLQTNQQTSSNIWICPQGSTSFYPTARYLLSSAAHHRYPERTTPAHGFQRDGRTVTQLECWRHKRWRQADPKG